MSQNKKKKRYATFAIAEVSEVVHSDYELRIAHLYILGCFYQINGRVETNIRRSSMYWEFAQYNPRELSWKTRLCRVQI